MTGGRIELEKLEKDADEHDARLKGEDSFRFRTCGPSHSIGCDGPKAGGARSRGAYVVSLANEYPF